MNDETLKIVSDLDTDEMDALEISGRYWGPLFNWKSYQTVHYPEFDLNKDMIHDHRFDIIFAEQVLEHIKYPRRAVANVHSMLKPGGRFLVTTPFLIQIHAAPEDYTRWTKDGLKYLLEEGGFSADKVKTGSWGNIDCVIADMSSCHQQQGWNVFDPTKHSLENDDLYPSVVWAVAVKD